MIVRWGLDALGELLVPYARPLLISTGRWRDLDVPVDERFHDVQPHAERTGVDGATQRARD